MKINLPTWRTLAVLNETGPATVTELAGATVVERTALTRTIAQMEKRGLVARETDSDDRRRAKIAVTERGTELYRKVVPAFEATQRRAVGAIPPARVQDLISTLQKIAENLEGHFYNPLMSQHGPSSAEPRKRAFKR